MKILIGYDGSPCAEAAILDLQKAGLPEKAEAVVLSAVDVFLPPKTDTEDSDDPILNYVPHGVKIARKRAREAFAEAERFAAEGKEKLQKIFPAWVIKAEAVADTPHWAIIAKAESWLPDLTVVGSHGRSAVGRAFFGSVSQKVLYESPTSVRIVRPKSDKNAAENIRLILAYDGSPDAETMLETVCAREWRKAVDVRLITAVEAVYKDENELEKNFSRVRDLQTSAAEKLWSKGLGAEKIVTDEDPKYFLVREAETWNADCIFLGAKGHRFLERVFPGSVSSSVAARAGCSVEIVRRKISAK